MDFNNVNRNKKMVIRPIENDLLCEPQASSQVTSFQLVDVNKILNKPLTTEKPDLKNQPSATKDTVTVVDIDKILKGSKFPHYDLKVVQLPEASTEIFSNNAFNKITNKTLTQLEISLQPKKLDVNSHEKVVNNVQLVDIKKILSETTDKDNNKPLVPFIKKTDKVFCIGKNVISNSKRLPSFIKTSQRYYLIPMKQYDEMVMLNGKSKITSAVAVPVQNKMSQPSAIKSSSSEERSLAIYQKLVESRPAHYQCLNIKNRYSKYDLGFYKMDYVRARHCSRILSMFVKKYEATLTVLTKKFQRFEALLPEINTNETCIITSPVKPSFSTLSMDELQRAIRRKSKIKQIFIYDYNLKIMSNFSKRDYFYQKSIYFVNTNSVQTHLYLDAFPLFKYALHTGEIKIVDKVVLQQYFKIIGKRCPISFSYTNPARGSNSKRKKKAFLDFVNRFHAAFETSNIVQFEHNYSTNL